MDKVLWTLGIVPNLVVWVTIVNMDIWKDDWLICNIGTFFALVYVFLWVADVHENLANEWAYWTLRRRGLWEFTQLCRTGAEALTIKSGSVLLINGFVFYMRTMKFLNTFEHVEEKQIPKADHLFLQWVVVFVHWYHCEKRRCDPYHGAFSHTVVQGDAPADDEDDDAYVSDETDAASFMSSRDTDEEESE
jgi:hypothetical protein